MNKRFHAILLACAFACAFGAGAAAQVPRTISYQGVLTDAAGNFIPDGNHTLALRLYDNLVAATPIYTETQTVPVVKGLFNVIIGTVTSIPGSLGFDRAYFLGVAVDGGLEMAPRTALSAVPYALRAAVADQAQTLAPGATGVVRSINGQDGAVTLQGGGGTTVNSSGGVVTISSSGGGGTGVQGVQSSDGSLAITNPNGPTANLVLAPDAVQNPHILNGAVTESKIPAGQVVKSLRIGGSTLYDDVTLAPGTGVTLTPSGNTVTIGTSGGAGITELQNGNNTLDIANPNGPVTTVNIRDGGVGATQLASGAVTTAKINASGAASGQVLGFDGSVVAWVTATGFAIPYANATSHPDALFALTNNGAGRAGYFRNDNATAAASALYGESVSPSDAAAGVEGVNRNGIGVIGRGASSTSAIYGINAAGSGPVGTGAGVCGFSDVGHGVHGISHRSISAGVCGSSSVGVGVRGISESSKAAEFSILSATNSENALEATTAGSGAGMLAVHAAATGTAPGVIGNSNSVDANATGVLGTITSSTPGGFSAAVRGTNNGTAGLGIGVLGEQKGSGWGVYGTAPSGIGVYGRASSSTGSGIGVYGETPSPGGAGVLASFSGGGVGCPLQIAGGPIRISGANRMAFVHTATVANKVTANGSEIDNAVCNGDPNAILIVTQLLNPANTAAYNNSAVGVYYDPSRQKWQLFNENAAAITTSAQFFVLVVKQ